MWGHVKHVACNYKKHNTTIELSFFFGGGGLTQLKFIN